MAFLTAATLALGAIGAASAVAGTVVAYQGQQQASKASARAEDARNRQMDLEAARQRRDVARRAMVARAESTSAATQAGAQYGSGLAGGQAQITGQAAGAGLGINQNQQIGTEIFQANKSIAAGQAQQSLGNSISGFGSMLFGNLDTFNRLGTYYSSKPATP